MAARAPEGSDFDERLEIHDGQVVRKEAARYEHSDAQLGIGWALRGPFQRKPGGDDPGGWWISVEPEVAYPNWTFLHDLAGWRRARVPDKPRGGPVTLAPDWVCEVLSSNRRHDTVTKFEILAKAGVAHYWLVDVDARELVVHRLEEGRWLRISAFVADEPGARARIEPFDAVELELGVLFGDDPTE